ncbi:MAG TPA: 3-methyl-2-oxobutanoate hydroxymethyltransferase [Polyangiaceae bacterium]|nr:3-methyl-2-oxobutanoate hydroxymethyltransferase [Polyangiaceae bacterium]
MSAKESKKLTVPAIRARKNAGPKISAVTAYDATMARLLDEAGVDVILVGDSLGMVVQGLPNTLPVTVDEVCYHARAVARAIRRAHLVGDLPFMSYQASIEQALVSSGRLLKEGGCEAVKLEGGEALADTVRAIVRAGIPVMGHVGLTPQSVHAMGGFRVQGKGEDAAARIVADARAIEQAGAYSLVIEGVPADLAHRITDAVSIPTIGIGAGPECDGQVLVCYDLLGMVRDLKPKFVKRYAELGDAVVDATRAFVEEVRSGAFPAAEHSFGMAPPRTVGEPTGTTPVVGSMPPPYGPAEE